MYKKRLIQWMILLPLLFALSSCAQSVFQDPSAGSCVDPDTNNTGNGSCTISNVKAFIQDEDITFTALESGPTASFSVSGSVSGDLGTVDSGSTQTIFNSLNYPLFDVNLSDGGTPYSSGDDFEVTLSAGTELRESNFDLFDLEEVCANDCDTGSELLETVGVLINGSSSGTVTVGSADTVSTPYTVKLPDAEGSVGQALKIDTVGSNIVQLEFADDLTSGNNLISAKSADYTITDVDNVRTILMTTGGTNRTVTLPTLADNLNRIITIKKEDSGSGRVIVDGESSETIDSFTTYVLTGVNGSVTLQAGATEWKILSSRGLKYQITYLGSNLTDSDNGIISGLSKTALQIGKTYRVQLHMTNVAVSNDTFVRFTVYNENTGSGTVVGIANGFTEVSGNRNTVQGSFVFTADNVNLVVNMDSLTSGNTILGTGGKDGSWMRIEEIEAAQDVGTLWN